MKSNSIFYIGCALILLPLFILCFYNHPVGPHDWEWPIQFAEFEMSFWEHQQMHYERLSGRYFSTFVLALTPYWFSLTTFKFFPIVLVSLLYAGLLFLGKSLIPDTPKQSQRNFALLIVVLFLVGLSGIFEMLYTISSGLLYLDTCIFSILWLGVFAKMYQHPNKLQIILLALLTIAINASNEINLLIINLVFAFYGLHTLLYRRKIPLWLVLMAVVSITSALFAVLAPANFNRIKGYEDSGDLIFALVFAAPAMIQNFLAWFVNTPLILVSILLWQPIKRIVSTRTHTLLEKHNMNWLVATLLATQYLPLVLLLYASGPNSLPERVMDVLYLHFLLAWFLVLANFIKNFAPESSFQMSTFTRNILSVSVLLFILFNPLKINRDLPPPKRLDLASITQYISIDNNIGKAYLTLLDGSAATYSKANYDMYEKLRNCPSDSCYVKPFEQYPEIIYEAVFDRKQRKTGDKFMMYYLDNRAARVFYEAK